ncbi:ABC transporter ATP-binding protein [Kiloniella sp. b19]|uniref:ABC transporter ATP-binding protein n=1 Tax=Kiloniella sp. GXU_MW_B19 TaxID=3141326 RepID=UPI0031DBD8D7
MLEANHLSVSLDGVPLIKDISFRLEEGGCLCVVGESGSGKTTLLKTLQGLLRFDGGNIRHSLADGGQTLCLEPGDSFLGLPGVSWVMQNPQAALNPRQRVGPSIAESLYHLKLPRARREELVLEALRAVELEPEMARRFPEQISLGQAQRVCLARALVSKPKVILFDEPLSALDAFVQKQVARTMQNIREQHGLGYVVVTHDLGYARAYADTILLMNSGRAVSCQPVHDFFNRPSSSYAAELIEAAEILGSLDSGTSRLPEKQIAS